MKSVCKWSSATLPILVSTIKPRRSKVSLLIGQRSLCTKSRKRPSWAWTSRSSLPISMLMKKRFYFLRQVAIVLRSRRCRRSLHSIKKRSSIIQQWMTTATWTSAIECSHCLLGLISKHWWLAHRINRPKLIRKEKLRRRVLKLQRLPMRNPSLQLESYKWIKERRHLPMRLPSKSTMMMTMKKIRSRLKRSSDKKCFE